MCISRQMEGQMQLPEAALAAWFLQTHDARFGILIQIVKFL